MKLYAPGFPYALQVGAEEVDSLTLLKAVYSFPCHLARLLRFNSLKVVDLFHARIRFSADE